MDNCCIYINLDLRKQYHVLYQGENKIEGRENIIEFLRDEYNIDSNNIFQILQQEQTSQILSDNSVNDLINIEKAVRYSLVYNYI